LNTLNPESHARYDLQLLAQSKNAGLTDDLSILQSSRTLKVISHMCAKCKEEKTTSTVEGKIRGLLK
jgi:hypothetical protein